MRARDRGRALGQIVALGAALAVIFTASPGTAVAQPAAQQQQQPQQQRDFKIVVVGDSFMAGQGVRGPNNGRSEPNLYFDAADPRHQSRESAAIQAAARIQAANPHLKVEVIIVASSGAATMDVFETQRRDPLETIPGNPEQNPIDESTWHDQNDLAVSTKQLDQIPTDADAVIVGLGGNDVFFAPMITSLAPGAANDTNAVLNKANPLLDTEQSDEAYREQARQGRENKTPGHAPTLIARLLQVMQAIQDKAPNAKMFLQNYPMAVDPNQRSFNSPLDKNELTEMAKFGERVNAAIKRAVEICGCADLVDVSKALQKRELYTRDPAMNDLYKGIAGAIAGNDANWTADESAHPNRKGASLMAGDIGEAVAKRFGFKIPPRRGDQGTDIRNITIRKTPAPDTDGDGEPDYRDKDWDGDGTPNTEDRTPNTPNTPQQTPRPAGSQTDRPTGQPGTPARQDPSPAPASPQQPNPAPQQPNPAPQQPNPAPQQPSPAPQQPNPAPQQPNPAPSPQPNPGQQPNPGTRPNPGAQPNPNPAPPQPNPGQQPNPGPRPNPSPQPNPAPPQQPNPSPQPPNQAPRTSSGANRSPVIPPTTAMRAAAVPSMPKPPSAPKLQGSIGPRGSQPLPIDRLGTPPPPPKMTVPSPPTTNPYPLGGSKPGDRSGGGGTRPSTPPPLPQKAPPRPPSSSDSFVGA